MAASKNIGIDFGTTNSSAVQFDAVRGISGNRYHLLGDGDRQPIPSVVAIDEKTGEVYTGREAWERRTELEESCVCINSIKSLLGDERWKQTIADMPWTVVSIAGRVFGALQDAAHYWRASIGKATVAIPVGLKPDARKMLRQAARMAGITVEEFVSESTAAFFANYEQLRSAGRVAVFDWGGGTLDVSILEHSRGKITELATNGMPVAGDAIDELLARRIHSIIAREKSVDVPFEEIDAKERDMLIVRCEQIKRAFSEEETARIFITRYDNRALLFNKNLSYEWFDEVINPIVADAIECLDIAIKDAGMTPAGIDCVLLVGGSSNLRPIQERMQERFEDRLFIPEDAVWCVSKGAAALSGQPGRYVSART